MFIVTATIIAVLAFGTFGWWWLLNNAAAVARRREENERELERPDHDFEHARQIAEIESDMSRLIGGHLNGSFP